MAASRRRVSPGAGPQGGTAAAQQLLPEGLAAPSAPRQQFEVRRSPGVAGAWPRTRLPRRRRRCALRRAGRLRCPKRGRSLLSCQRH